MNAQLQLAIKEPKQVDSGPLEAVLLAAGDWITAREIKAEKGWDDRTIRAMASASSLIVSGPGCPGYKHFHHCTINEINEARNRLIHQARDMSERAQRLAQLAHKKLAQ